ncbi:MAG: ThiF family adenylyltransferase [Spirochaetales bacterium]|nr:ThiF family adenylyltransferase [Spirochaetales bacterium]
MKKKSTTEDIINQMKLYFRSDFKRIDHALSVLGYARQIMEDISCNREIVEAACVLHDIGIHMAEKKYHSTAGHLQEKEGPPIAEKILKDLGYDREFIQEVCLIVGNHHSPGKVETANFQAVYEADWLVNLQDDFKHFSEEKKMSLIAKNFKTGRGKKLAKETVANAALSEEECIRYSRNIQLEEVGPAGQLKLKKARVLVIGVGGLGSPCALYLAAAGIGTLGLADPDSVELSNLQRQVLHFTKDITKSKVFSAGQKLSALNPATRIIEHKTRIDKSNISGIVTEYDFIIDCTDNFASKFIINDGCIKAGKPFSHGGILKYEGQSMTVIPGKTACYRCLFTEEPSGDLAVKYSRAGLLGPVPGIIGTIQAMETIKYILEFKDLLTDSILTFNGLKMIFRRVVVKKKDNCPACGKEKTE